ncbi:MAG: YkgJ family cysteine cluster protein [Halobacteriota archaeon]|nr:YkgJ family cysteine cluster protein [Halobacteriota archaeon]
MEYKQEQDGLLYLLPHDSQKGSSCKNCGRCCHYVVPATLHDIYRIARFMNISDKDVFDEYIEGTISKEHTLFKIKRRENTACAFLTDENFCSIHPAKPRTCKFFVCNPPKEDEPKSCWLGSCTHSKPNFELLEFSIAIELTKAFIIRNKGGWNEAEYSSAIYDLKKRINDSRSKRVALLRDFAGRPIIKTFDCDLCDVFESDEVETPVTLEDIKRIMCHLNLDGKTFFDEYLSLKPSKITGGLKLIGGRNCIFRSPDGISCKIEKAMPIHCRNTFCPAHIYDYKLWERKLHGIGTIEEQFRSQVALSITREYVAQCGTVFNGPIFEEKLEWIQRLSSMNSELKSYYMKLALYGRVRGNNLIMPPNF